MAVLKERKSAAVSALQLAKRLGCQPPQALPARWCWRGNNRRRGSNRRRWGRRRGRGSKRGRQIIEPLFGWRRRWRRSRLSFFGRLRLRRSRRQRPALRLDDRRRLRGRFGRCRRFRLHRRLLGHCRPNRSTPDSRLLFPGLLLAARHHHRLVAARAAQRPTRPVVRHYQRVARRAFDPQRHALQSHLPAAGGQLTGIRRGGRFHSHVAMPCPTRI